MQKIQQNLHPSPDDDVISYGSDLNIITKGGEPATRYVRAGGRALTHTQGRTEGVCEQANHLQQREEQTDAVRVI